MFTLRIAFVATFFSLMASVVPAQGTVLKVIQDDPDLSMFAQALSATGLDAVLSDNSKQFTVFAPSNAAIDSDEIFKTYMTKDGWVYHLRTNIQFMIVPNEALSDSEIFDQVKTELISLNGTLAISQPFAQVNLVAVERPNNVGSNGIVHVTKGVIKNDWRQYTLKNVDVHEELTEGLSPILTRVNFSEPLDDFVPAGTSWIAGRNRAYGDDSIALGFNPIVLELESENETDFQSIQDAMLYNLVDLNFYEQDIERGFQLLLFPRNPVAHMWVTKDQEKGILRFNDAELDRQAFADNG
jgi:hypothetical protein